MLEGDVAVTRPQSRPGPLREAHSSTSIPPLSSNKIPINTDEKPDRYRRYMELENHPPYESPMNRIRAHLELLEARVNALHTLSLCRTAITTLELTRMRISRIGYASWLTDWRDIFRQNFIPVECIIGAAHRKINILFSDMARELHQVVSRTEGYVRNAPSKADVHDIMDQMEAKVGSYRRLRRRRARHYLERMVSEFEELPLKVDEPMLNYMKRRVFGLDFRCNYYPVDPQVEDGERRQYFVQLHGPRLEVFNLETSELYQLVPVRPWNTETPPEQFAPTVTPVTSEVENTDENRRPVRPSQ